MAQLPDLTIRLEREKILSQSHIVGQIPPLFKKADIRKAVSGEITCNLTYADDVGKQMASILNGSYELGTQQENPEKPSITFSHFVEFDAFITTHFAPDSKLSERRAIAFSPVPMVRCKRATHPPNVESVDALIEALTPFTPISEIPTDIEEVGCRHDAEVKCLKCRICGSISGTSRIISHYCKCKYHISPKFGPYTMGTRMNGKDSGINPHLAEAILQREYGIVSRNKGKTIIGSYGAGPCVILCMHNKKKQKAILAHIDARTEFPLGLFITTFPDVTETDVYIVGGDISSAMMTKDIIDFLAKHQYNIVFAHVSSKMANCFAIDCITGETWLDDEVDIAHLPVTVNKRNREDSLFHRLMHGSPQLFEVDIPRTRASPRSASKSEKKTSPKSEKKGGRKRKMTKSRKKNPNR